MTRTYVAFGTTVLLATLFFSADRGVSRRHATPPAPDSCPSMEPVADREPDELSPRAVADTPPTLEAAFDSDGRFAVRLALFRLAVRADSEALQKLVFDADRLPDETRRREALLVFLERMTELDPPTALALARSISRRHERALLTGVWQHWAIIDLDSALQAARIMTDTRERDLAAQAMLAAHGYAGTVEAETIGASLGVTVDADGRSRLFERLVAQSPTLAFDYVNAMKSGDEMDYAIRQLARILVASDGREAAAYASLLEQMHLQDLFLAEVVTAIGAHDPGAAMDVIAGIDDIGLRYQLQARVIRRIVDRDPRFAAELADRIMDTRMRDMAYYRIVEHHAGRNPVEAAVWSAYISDPMIRDYAAREIRWARERHAW
jgi:hypothetical protein